MAIIGKTQRDLRRRRALVDENAYSESGTVFDHQVCAKGSNQASEQRHRYTKAALAENQPLITDFLPKRNWTLLVYALLGFVFVCLFAFGELIHLQKPTGRNEILQILKPNSIAAWFAASLMMLAAMLSLFVFGLRRQRIDDYKARYRIWLPVAALSMLVSLDSTTAIGSASRELFVEVLAPRATLAANLLIWVPAIIVAYFAVRLFFELRMSRIASFWFLLSGASYIVFAVVSQVPSLVSPFENVAAGTSWLLGHLGLNMCLFSFARYVFLDAQGSIKVRSAKKKRIRLRWKTAPTDLESTKSLKPKTMPKSAAPKTAASNQADTDGRKAVAEPKAVATQNTVAATSSASKMQSAPSPKTAAESPLRNRVEKSSSSTAAAHHPQPSHRDDSMDPDMLDMPNQQTKAERKRLRKEKRRQSRAA